MDLVTPSIGLVFWTTLCFAILLFILGKFAWKPILAAISEREKSIESALSMAEAAKEEMARLTSENDELLKQARIERDNILRASLWALARAVAALPLRPQLVFVDGRDRIMAGCA